jgi:hypothetical protein
MTADRPSASIYAVGAGPGGIARAVMALEPAIPVHVEECDAVMPETTALPCVVGARTEPLRRRTYDAIAMVLPAPAIGGAVNHRRIYRRDRRRGFDLSGMSETQWMLHVEWQLSAVKDLLEDDGTLFLLVDSSVRCDRRYEPRPRLLESALRSASDVGFSVTERNLVIEVDPVRQPFVGTNRPEKWSLVLRHSDTQSREVSYAST